MDIQLKLRNCSLFFFLSLLFIFFRCWYLSVFKHQYYLEKAEQSRSRIGLERAERAPIYDRFGIPLATNMVQYNVSVLYADIKQIPAISWKKDKSGKRHKYFPRIRYIEQLAQMLSKELAIPSLFIEDIIHGRAALLPHTVCAIKEEIKEEQYYRLKMVEKDWIGLEVERVSRRNYPLGKVACHILGYMGAIDSRHYLKKVEELKRLEEYLSADKKGEHPFLPEGFSSSEALFLRYIELRERAYTADDLVGKSGVEAFYEEELRGVAGKRIYKVDIKGNPFREIEGSYPPTSGSGIKLTISAELQGFAENLLAAAEFSYPELDQIDEKWIRGGSIVALKPETGEVIALASYPSFDPNDFIGNNLTDREKPFRIHKWLETEQYIGDIWDGLRPLERERFSFVTNSYIQEQLPMTLSRYVVTLLASRPHLIETMNHIVDITTALEVQEEGIDHPLLTKIGSDQERLLILDLCHLFVPNERFSSNLRKEVNALSLADFDKSRKEAMQLLDKIKIEIRPLFDQLEFAEWRKLHFQQYLKEKREKERKTKRYTKPYTDYLKEVESRLWNNFWNSYKPFFLYTLISGEIPLEKASLRSLAPYFSLLQDFYKQNSSATELMLRERTVKLSPDLRIDFLKTFRSFSELDQPLKANFLSKERELEKHLASAFYPQYGYGFLRSQAFQVSSPLGSVFKLITSYAFLLERYRNHQPLNPLTIIDDLHDKSVSSEQILGFWVDGSPIYRNYKGGRLPRSSHKGIGKIDLLGAIEQSSNIYFSLIAGDMISDPQKLAQAASSFGLAHLTGIDLTGEIAGHLPDDLDRNKTGLYSFAIGQHSFETTPIQTAVAISTIANGGTVVTPHIRLADSNEVFSSVHLKYSLPFYPEISEMIIEGMRRVVSGDKGTARPKLVKAVTDHPFSLKDYLEIMPEFIGKTGTAEVEYRANSIAKGTIKNNIWFTGIAYPKGELLSSFQHPNQAELVVVVYLPFRQTGHQGAIIAAQIVKKWREIQNKHKNLATNS